MDITFNTMSILVNDLNNTFSGSLEALVTMSALLCAAAFVISLINGIRLHLQKSKYERLAGESEVIECLSAEDVTLQEHLDHKVQVFSHAKSGRWYARQKIKVVANTVSTSIVDNCVYSAEEYVAEELELNPSIDHVRVLIWAVKSDLRDAGIAAVAYVMGLVLPGLSKVDKVVSTKRDNLVLGICLMLAAVLPAAKKVDDLVNMPTQIEELKNEVVELRLQVKAGRVKNTRQHTADVQYLLNTSGEDVVEPHHLS